jgi:hypothetical protein
MRVLLFGFLVAALAGCGDDDDDDSDAGRDAGADIVDGGAGAVDASSIDAGDAATCDVEFTTPWISYTPAKRASLDELCGKDDCPKNWEAALARARAAKPEEPNVGCYVAWSRCGSNKLELSWITHDWIWVFDADTGALIGAAHQFTDLAGPGACSFVEVVAGTDGSADKPRDSCSNSAPPMYYGFCRQEEDAGTEDGGR